MAFCGGDHDDLGVAAVGGGAGHGGLHAVGEGHAVPHHVDGLAVELVDLLAPLNDDELHVHSQALGYQPGQLRVKAGPLAVVVLIVHGGKLRDAHHQGALAPDISHVAAGILGIAGLGHLRQQVLPDAELPGQGLGGAVLIGLGQNGGDEVGQVRALAAADAVLLLGEAVGIGQVGIAGVGPDHGLGHQ